MSNDSKIKCPHCRAALRLPAEAKAVRCPKCQTTFRAMAEAEHKFAPAGFGRQPSTSPATNRNQAPPIRRPAPVRTAQDSVHRAPPLLISGRGLIIDEGVLAYLRSYFLKSCGTLWVFVPLALLMCFLVSLLKPWMGGERILPLAFGVIAASVAALLGFTIFHSLSFLVGKPNINSKPPKSLLAKTCVGFFVVGSMLAIWGAAERFAPPSGILASTIPQLEATQKSLLKGSIGTAVQDGESNAEPPKFDERQPPTQTSPPGLQNSSNSSTAQDGKGNSSQKKPLDKVAVPNSSDQPRSALFSTGTPEPGGSFSAKLDLTITALPGGSGLNTGQPSASPSKNSPADFNNDSAAVTGASGGEATGAAPATPRSTLSVTVDPGGTFPETLKIPIGTKLLGGGITPVEPGGAFNEKK